MNTQILHRPHPGAPYRVDAIAFGWWVTRIPAHRQGQAIRVARYLAIRANREKR